MDKTQDQTAEPTKLVEITEYSPDTEDKKDDKKESKPRKPLTYAELSKKLSFLTWQGLKLFNLCLCFDRESSLIFLLNKKRTRILTTIQARSAIYTNLKDFIISRVKKPGWQMYLQYHSLDVQKNFDPSAPLIYGEDFDKQINLYKTPSYMGKAIKTDLDISAYHEFMFKLFPCVNSRKIVEAWTWQSLLDKAKTHLLLCGAKGTGKTFFSSNLMAALHGTSNHYVESISQMKSDFSSVDHKKTLIFIDECSFNSDELKSKVKYRLNPYAGLKLKYQNAGDTQRTFSSLILACNDAATIMVEVDDRCFTVPNISQTPATLDTDHFKNINKIAKILVPTHRLHKSFLRGIYEYLKTTYSREDEDRVLLLFTDNFKDLVLRSDSILRRAIYETAMAHPTFILDDVKEALFKYKYTNASLMSHSFIKKTNEYFKLRFKTPVAEFDPTDQSYTSKVVGVAL